MVSVEVGQPLPGALQRLTVVVELAAVVEHHQASGSVARLGGGQDHVDRVGQVVDAGGEDGGLGLGDDRLQLGDRRAGLQRHRDGAGDTQRDVDGGVVDAGEAEYADPVTGGDQPVGQRAGHLADPLGQLAVGDLVEPGQQLGWCARSAGL